MSVAVAACCCLNRVFRDSFFADFLLVLHTTTRKVEKEAAGEHGWRPLGSLVYSEAEPCSLTTQWGIFNWIVASSLRAK